MRIAVYPGSFDPLHIGHLAIMKYLSDDPRFDEVYLVISPQSPFKAPEKARNAEERYRAAIEAVSRYPGLKVKVEDIELKMPAPHYTIRTLDCLREREPENEFTLVVGADNLKNIHRWRDADRMLSEYSVIAYPREGYDLVEIRDALLAADPSRRIFLIDAPLVNVSSTEIRGLLAQEEDPSLLMM